MAKSAPTPDLLHHVHVQALQKGNLEGARIHAENAIRQKNQVCLTMKGLYTSMIWRVGLYRG